MGGKGNRSTLVSKEQQSLPGPGVYNKQSDLTRSSKSFTMMGRPQDKKQDANPGPGSYEAKNGMSKSTTMTPVISTTKRIDIVSKESKNAPGPGQYSSNNKTIGSDSKKMTIGKVNEHNPRNDSPGPGKYDDNISPVKDRIQSANFGK